MSAPDDRVAAWAEIEELTYWMVELGWKLRQVVLRDDVGAPIQARIVLEKDPKSELNEPL